MLYIIFITVILFFVLVFLFVTHINIDNNKKIDLNNIDNPKEILTFISVKNYDNQLINIINTSSISGIIINIDDLDVDILFTIIKNIKRNINRKIFIALDQDYKSTYSVAYHQKFKVYPSYIGEKKSEEYAYKISYERAVKLKSIGINRINRALENLFDIDYKIKSGVIEKNIAFELFIDNF